MTYDDDENHVYDLFFLCLVSFFMMTNWLWMGCCDGVQSVDNNNNVGMLSLWVTIKDI